MFDEIRASWITVLPVPVCDAAAMKTSIYTYPPFGLQRQQSATLLSCRPSACHCWCQQITAANIIAADSPFDAWTLLCLCVCSSCLGWQVQATVIRRMQAGQAAVAVGEATVGPKVM